MSGSRRLPATPRPRARARLHRRESGDRRDDRQRARGLEARDRLTAWHRATATSSRTSPSCSWTSSAEPYEFERPRASSASPCSAWETNTYALDIGVVVQRTAEELGRWRLATYTKIRAAYDERVRQYNEQVEGLRADAEAKAERDAQRAVRRAAGREPAHDQCRAEEALHLDHHAAALRRIRRHARTADPPYFDFAEAAEEGAYVRFFEQAFEWDQMQYVFYPYFWARKSTWIDRFVKQDVDPVFLEFLRAGSARVVVPVRPGFEVAVTHFIETGKIWGGDGDPPAINSPLYVSIVDEIRERTGAPQGEQPVGDPWDVRVPTVLVIVRDEGDLPRWERVAPGEWSWLPVESG